MSLISPTVFIVATWIAAVCGGVGIAAAFVSAIVGYQLSEKAVTDSNVKIADAEARTKEAELKLEQLRKLAGPRSLDQGVFVKELEGKPKPRSVAIWFLPDSSDGWMFSFRLYGALITAGWPVTNPTPIPESPKEIIPWRDIPRTMVAGGQPSGVTVVGGTIDMSEPWFKPLFDALAKSTDFGIYGSGGSQWMPVPPGTLRIIVAAKVDPMFAAPTTSAPASK
jgi:hypothetical protein